MKTIDPKPLAESHLSGQKIQLLDVRTPAEFEEAHIAGSKLAPLDSLNPGHVSSSFDPEQPIYVVCRSGNRAQRAIQQLQTAGFDSVVLLNGGINAWSEHDLPLNRGKETMGLERQVRIAAGVLIAVGALLGFLVNPLWHLMSAFVGVGLAFAGLTNSCAMGMLIAKMPWNQRGSAGICGDLLPLNVRFVCHPPSPLLSLPSTQLSHVFTTSFRRIAGAVCLPDRMPEDRGSHSD